MDNKIVIKHSNLQEMKKRLGELLIEKEALEKQINILEKKDNTTYFDMYWHHTTKEGRQALEDMDSIMGY